jgi:hypothetical protein
LRIKLVCLQAIGMYFVTLAVRGHDPVQISSIVSWSNYSRRSCQNLWIESTSNEFADGTIYVGKASLFLQSNVLDVITRQDPGMPRDAEACDTEE